MRCFSNICNTRNRFIRTIHLLIKLSEILFQFQQNFDTQNILIPVRSLVHSDLVSDGVSSDWWQIVWLILMTLLSANWILGKVCGQSLETPSLTRSECTRLLTGVKIFWVSIKTLLDLSLLTLHENQFIINPVRTICQSIGQKNTKLFTTEPIWGAVSCRSLWWYIFKALL